MKGYTIHPSTACMYFFQWKLKQCFQVICIAFFRTVLIAFWKDFLNALLKLQELLALLSAMKGYILKIDSQGSIWNVIMQRSRQVYFLDIA